MAECQNKRMGKRVETIWDRIEEAMRDAGYTRGFQTGAAKIAKIKQPSVYGWKVGATPEMQHIVALAKELGVCVEWLYMGRGPKRPGESLPPDLGEMADFWERLPLDVRAEIVGFAKYKRSISFTGDPEKREVYQEQIGRKESTKGGT